MKNNKPLGKYHQSAEQSQLTKMWVAVTSMFTTIPVPPEQIVQLNREASTAHREAEKMFISSEEAIAKSEKLLDSISAPPAPVTNSR